MRLSPVVRCVSRMKCFAHYGYLGLIAIGVAYHLLYVFPGWPVSTGLLISGMTVGFVYWFLGGYGWLRLRWTRTTDDAAQSNRPIALVLLLVALWDVLSPLAFMDLSPAALVPHVVGGAAAAVLAGIEMYEDPELREEMLHRPGVGTG